MAGFFKKFSGPFLPRKEAFNEKKIKYRFKNIELLKLALSHRSFTNVTGSENKISNERLEFLGDSVLDLVATEYLYSHYPNKDEGGLSQMKSLIVSKKSLIKAAKRIEVGQHLLISKSEERTGGRKRVSILADAVEAIIAAIYLDGGYIRAKAFIEEFVLEDIDLFLSDENNINFKSQLLEFSQRMKLGNPDYNVTSETGPDHNKTFAVTVSIGEKIWGTGTGKSKKEAEQLAAKEAVNSKESNLLQIQGAAS